MFSPARSITTIFLILLSVLRMAGELSFVVVADATTRSPLPFASVFNRDGKAICIMTAMADSDKSTTKITP